MTMKAIISWINVSGPLACVPTSPVIVELLVLEPEMLLRARFLRPYMVKQNNACVVITLDISD